ncbi:ABC transporter permease subunit [Fundicoccus sp. Sow4_D5]|uniref:ABC transporter permease subunit n=1 Tax=Fundicoccus sp. Sow4_D5 TaxID=3438782 RepID=UPI003F8DCF5B
MPGVLSLIPGLGQIYNKQYGKGILFMVLGFLFVFQIGYNGIEAISNLITLGSVPFEDHSLFLLIIGVLQILLIVLYIAFYIIQIIDAHRVQKLKVIAPEKVGKNFLEVLRNGYEIGFPYLLLSFSYVLMLFAIVFPVIVTVLIVFTDYDFNHIPPANIISWTGLETFKKIFTLSIFRKTFFSVFSWTVIWTLCGTTLQIVIGVVTALIMNRPTIRFKRFIGVILLLPWAVPGFITILTFSNIFNPSIGAINTQVIPFINNLLPFFEIGMIPWKTDPFWTKVAIILIQGWLGYPYIYVLVTGILQSIPDEMYEAASIDGASVLQKIANITLPQVLTVAAPVFITQYTGNFNNFGMIYLFNEGGPGSVGNGAGTTDILISWIYKLTTGGAPQYNIAATLTIFVSFIVIGISLVIFKRFNAFEMED